MTPANSDKNLNIFVKTPTTVRANRYGQAVRTDSKKKYLAGCEKPFRQHSMNVFTFAKQVYQL